MLLNKKKKPSSCTAELKTCNTILIIMIESALFYSLVSMYLKNAHWGKSQCSCQAVHDWDLAYMEMETTPLRFHGYEGTICPGQSTGIKHTIHSAARTKIAVWTSLKWEWWKCWRLFSLGSLESNLSPLCAPIPLTSSQSYCPASSHLQHLDLLIFHAFLFSSLLTRCLSLCTSQCLNSCPDLFISCTYILLSFTFLLKASMKHQLCRDWSRKALYDVIKENVKDLNGAKVRCWCCKQQF